MVPKNSRLAALSADDRQAVESWLVAFDQGWDDRSLVRRSQEIPAGSVWRLPALAEMVKLDLQRQWRRGRQVSLESYLQAFPELGTASDVSADLILAEFDVRREFGASAVLDEYLQRFPNQAAEIAGLIARRGSASQRSAAGSEKPRPVAANLDLPEQFGRYRVIKRLGQGGMGSVYLAEDTRLQRSVALKVTHLDTHDDLEARRRLLAEARAAATLDHPYLCPVYDAGEIGDRLYLTMAYIDGQSLAEATGGNSLPPRQAAALVGKLALALQAAHANGVIHRDLKPSNVMIKTIGTRREPVIVDFGLAHRENPNESRITRTGQVMGTLGYMAPEQLRGERNEIGPACDIYALGVILYELLTGELPFSGWGPALIGQILTQEPPPPSTIRPDLDSRLEAICLKAMAKTVALRYQSMAELAAALTDVLRSPSALAPSPAAPPAGGDLLVNETQAPSESLSTGSVPPMADTPWERMINFRDAESVSVVSQPPRPSGGLPWASVGIAVAVVIVGFLAWWSTAAKVATPPGVSVTKNAPRASKAVDAQRKPIVKTDDIAPLEPLASNDEKAPETSVENAFKGPPEPLARNDEPAPETAAKNESRAPLETVTKNDGTAPAASVKKDDAMANLQSGKDARASAPRSAKTRPSKNVRARPTGIPSLFNGRDLSGWQVPSNQANQWRVENGILIGKGGGESYLYTERGDYRNFHLYIEARFNNITHSGVFFRALPGLPYVKSETDCPAWYEAQIAGQGGPNSMATGSLLAGGKRFDLVVVKQSYPANQWFVMEVFAVDNHIVILVNGETAADFIEVAGCAPAGHIVLQHMGGDSVVEFRRIAISPP